MAEFLEQQWDHAAQFLMEQAQHLDGQWMICFLLLWFSFVFLREL